ncbi:Major Facilitator Superfamily protein [Nannocystis exedens]|uniref:Major Facilitator Superfamily protein n=1 Tax=Nannocystis exedens TaxID=54 RepID=A0A1I2HSL5_9BACT|nr:MFS transporter [Nannocystis exedens]PCC69436.1 MFS transporter [Nannocystis exedens]SFF31847.1 Major Facilitator Superfamily protein [Nannocystis exedens]
MPDAPSIRWFPGYTVVAVAAVASIASAPGQTFLLSQLNAPLRATFDIGELALNGAYTLATLTAALPLVVIGQWTDRLGPRHMLAVSGAAAGLACLVMSSAVNLLTVFLGFFALRLFTAGTLSVVSQHALAMWFHRRLGSIHGVMQVAVFGVWVLAPQLALYLIETIGWRQTYGLFGVMIAVAVIPAAYLLVKNRPEDVGHALDGDRPAPEAATAGAAALSSEPGFTLAEAMRTRSYWTLVAATFVPPLIGTAMIFDIQPILAERALTPADAAVAVSAWSGIMGAWALPAGMLADRVSPRRLLPVAMAVLALSSLSFAVVSSRFTAVLAIVSLGVGNSTVAACASTALARYFGRRHHGAIRSSVTRIAVIGTGLGTLVTGVSFELTRSYLPALIIFASMCLPVLVLALSARPPEAPSARHEQVADPAAG